MHRGLLYCFFVIVVVIVIVGVVVIDRNVMIMGLIIVLFMKTISVRPSFPFPIFLPSSPPLPLLPPFLSSSSSYYSPSSYLSYSYSSSPLPLPLPLPLLFLPSLP